MKLGATPEERADRLVALIVVAGVLGSPFYQTDATREQLLGTATVPPQATLAVLCLSLALAWRSTLRRGWLWADPAQLTWSDFDGSRPRTLTRRLVLSWAGRFALAGYATVVSGILIGLPDVPVACLLFCGVAALALAMARRPPIRVETVAPLALAALGVAAVWVDVRWFWLCGGISAFAAIVLVRGEPLAARAGRAELVRAFRERMVRRMAASFLDVWVLLPAGRPVSWGLAGRFVVVRYLLAGIAARGRSLGLPVFLAAAIAALHPVVPDVGGLWWTGLGGYLAVLPLAAPVAQLYRVPGLRRWLGCTDRTLRLTAAGVLFLPVAGWFGVLLLVGVPFSAPAALAVPLTAFAIVRTVTRGPIDFANVGLVSLEGVIVPAGLVVQLARGPELLLLGLALLQLV